MYIKVLFASLAFILANLVSGAVVLPKASGCLQTTVKNSTKNQTLESQISRQWNDTWVEDAFEALGFEPDGVTEIMMAIRNPGDAITVRRINNEAFAVSKQEFPGLGGHNDAKDGFRHAYFSLRLTQELGSDAAKQWGDAHERSNPNPPGETIMDLRNNRAGRALSRTASPGQQGAINAIHNAIRNGSIQTVPRRQRR